MQAKNIQRIQIRYIGPHMIQSTCNSGYSISKNNCNIPIKGIPIDSSETVLKNNSDNQIHIGNIS